MTENSAKTIYSDLSSEIKTNLRRAKSKVHLIAPFIKYDTFSNLLEAIHPSVTVKVFTRWRAEEVARGVSDPSILDLIQSRKGEDSIYLNDNLHAKAYIVDQKILMLGSANLTHRALGLLQTNNIELLHTISPLSASIPLWLRKLELDSVYATEEIRSAVLLDAQQLEEKYVDPGILPTKCFSVAISKIKDDFIFPRYRSPDRVYQVFYHQEDYSPHTLNAVLDDLLGLNMPIKDFRKDDFESTVKEKLLSLPVVKVINEELSESRRFGHMVRWLQKNYPTQFANRDNAKGQMQIIYRWLTYFAPDIYEVFSNPYSEIITRKK